MTTQPYAIIHTKDKIIGVPGPVVVTSINLPKVAEYLKQAHRIDGPAVFWHNGRVEYRINGLRHRMDGPAVEGGLNLPSEWWFDGVWYLGGKYGSIPQYVLENYMRVNNYTLAHLLTDPDPLVRKSVEKYKWEE